MNLVEFKNNLDAYFTIYNSYTDCECLLPHIKSPIHHSYHGREWWESRTFVNVGDESFKKANDIIIEEYSLRCLAISKCLRIDNKAVLPEVDLTRGDGHNPQPSSIAIGAGIGVLVGSIFTGGLSIFATVLGGLIGSRANDENRTTVSSKKLYENSLILKKYCVDHFRQIIDEMLLKGIKNVAFDFEWGLYYAKCTCPICGKRLKAVNSQYGWFMGCTGYPNCKYKTKYIPVPKK